MLEEEVREEEVGTEVEVEGETTARARDDGKRHASRLSRGLCSTDSLPHFAHRLKDGYPC